MADQACLMKLTCARVVEGRRTLRREINKCEPTGTQGCETLGWAVNSAFPTFGGGK